MITPTVCSFFARFPPFRRNPGALAIRQQIFFTNQQVAERSQQMQFKVGWSFWPSSDSGLCYSQRLVLCSGIDAPLWPRRLAMNQGAFCDL
jgi:hypothetical protein